MSVLPFLALEPLEGLADLRRQVGLVADGEQVVGSVEDDPDVLLFRDLLQLFEKMPRLDLHGPSHRRFSHPAVPAFKIEGAFQACKKRAGVPLYPADGNLHRGQGVMERIKSPVKKIDQSLERNPQRKGAQSIAGLDGRSPIKAGSPKKQADNGDS